MRENYIQNTGGIVLILESKVDYIVQKWRYTYIIVKYNFLTKA